MELNFKKNKLKVILLEIFNSSITILFNFLILLITLIFIINKIEKIGIIFVIPSLIFMTIQGIRIATISYQKYLAHRKFLKNILHFKKRKICSNQSIDIEWIQVKNLNYSIDKKDIFKNINLTFEKGKKYAIIGSSGTGKSTLIKILTKQIQSEKFNIFFNDIKINDIDNCILNNSFGYLEHKNSFFNSSIYENITLWENIETKKVLNSLEKTNIFLDETTLLKENNNLSSGEKQRINLARFFLNKKNILILDEAFSQVDRENLKIIWKKINENKDLLLINVTHHINEFEKYDEIINLEEINEINI
ncbi:ATP-binding cassette domain-containing protein [[Mycoplasma] collis]|uniref:ATP-binding cassette domain-containing protein n=1 Tax=[Mycoplasma] collis TaxID=2127 RepID=UPI000B2FF057|nr:ABC transporter ATP-binding protein [[Mycoplasma] collis]